MIRAGRLAALGLALAFGAGACLPDASVAPSVAPRSATPDATPVVTQADLGSTIWYEGFAVDFGHATATLDPGGGDVTVTLTFHNGGVQDRAFDAAIRLVSGTTVAEPAHGTDFPEVPAGGGTASMDVPFQVVGPLAIGDASFVIGATADHQAVVPFASGADAITLEPSTVPKPAKPSATGGLLRVAMSAGQVRADLPDWGTELPRDRLVLTLTYEATYVGTFSGGMAFTAGNVGLQLPDGTVVAPRKDGRSQSIALLLPRKTQRGLTSRFEIPAPAGGTYLLLVREGGHQSSISLTVPKVG